MGLFNSPECESTAGAGICPRTVSFTTSSTDASAAYDTITGSRLEVAIASVAGSHDKNTIKVYHNAALTLTTVYLRMTPHGDGSTCSNSNPLIRQVDYEVCSFALKNSSEAAKFILKHNPV